LDQLLNLTGGEEMRENEGGIKWRKEGILDLGFGKEVGNFG
jgi:hypothetical protein